MSHAVQSRPPIQALRASRIREVANAGMGRADVLPFWFGEPDEVTPDFIRDVAKQALDDGDTFYTQNFGLPALREALAVYSSRLHQPTDAANIAVTSSGVSALMLIAQLLLNPGDRVVISARVIPGHEKAIARTINHLFQRGAAGRLGFIQIGRCRGHGQCPSFSHRDVIRSGCLPHRTAGAHGHAATETPAPCRSVGSSAWTR